MHISKLLVVKEISTIGLRTALRAVRYSIFKSLFERETKTHVLPQKLGILVDIDHSQDGARFHFKKGRT